MKQFNKTKIAAAVGTAALAMSLAAPANAAISLGGDNGWEVTYGGFINLFYTQSNWDFRSAPSEDSSHLQEGLLPAFHTFTVKSPTVNGLTGTGQITFAVDSSGAKGVNLNKGGADIDMREVFFNVEGSFGTISAGRTLALFQRQAILKDYTLFSVGAMAGPDTGGTSLGRIGFGYVYPDFRTRFVYQTPNMNGFQVSVGVFDPDESNGFSATPGGLFSPGVVETDTPQFQGEATYNTAFGGGNISAWVGGIWQEEKVRLTGGSDDVTVWGIDAGMEVTYGGFNVGGHYYTGDALGTIFLQDVGAFTCTATTCTEADNDGYYVQGSYTFNGKTKLGVTYGQSTQDYSGFASPDVNSMWTVGIYHDVNSWLKLVAEYSDQQSNLLHHSTTALSHDAQTFSVGGFLLW